MALTLDEIKNIANKHLGTNEVEMSATQMSDLINKDYADKVDDVVATLSSAGLSKDDIDKVFSAVGRRITFTQDEVDKDKENEKVDMQDLLARAKAEAKAGDGLISKADKDAMEEKRKAVDERAKPLIDTLQQTVFTGKVDTRALLKKKGNWKEIVKRIAQHITGITNKYDVNATNKRRKFQEGDDVDIKIIKNVLITIDHSGSMRGVFNKMLDYLPELLRSCGCTNNTEIIGVAWSSGNHFSKVNCRGPKMAGAKIKAMPFLGGCTEWELCLASAKKACAKPDIIIHMSDYDFYNITDTSLISWEKRFAKKTIWVGPVGGRFSASKIKNSFYDHICCDVPKQLAVKNFCLVPV